jgi:predicted RNA-binding Zn ribbon-like protein
MFPAFLIGALAGIVALGLIWAMTTVLTGSDNGTDNGQVARTPATPATGAEPTQHAQASPPSGPEDRCRQADAELARPLRAAVPALDQWEIHVGAMNKLVVGAITLQQATAFWHQTRVGAHQRLNRFYAAAREVPLAGVGCPSPGALPQASRELRSCAQHVAQERQALGAARIAMRTWRRHVRDMEMLRTGHLSPAAAQRMWLANWQRGVRELEAYRGAKRAVDRSTTC